METKIKQQPIPVTWEDLHFRKHEWKVDTEGRKYDDIVYLKDLKEKRQQTILDLQKRLDRGEEGIQNEDGWVLTKCNGKKAVLEKRWFSWVLVLEDGKTPRHVEDSVTRRKYLNESEGLVRRKCFLLTLGTPESHLVASLANLIFRIGRIISGYHFWPKREGSYDLKERCSKLKKDFSIILATITGIGCLALFAAAIYGIINPYDGRRIYASLERALYGRAILAPCFQPEEGDETVEHLLGSNPRTQGGF